MRTSQHMFSVCTAVVLVVLMIGACGPKNVSEGMVPDWFLNPPESQDKIYGTGASEQTSSIQLAKQVADANARTALAQTIQVSVQSMVRTFLQQSGTIETTRALQFSEVVGKNVVDITLTGVRIERSEMQGGRYFSLASVSYDSMKNALLSQVRDAAAQMAEQKAKQAFQDLEKEINRGKIPIVKE